MKIVSVIVASLLVVLVTACQSGESVRPPVATNTAESDSEAIAMGTATSAKPTLAPTTTTTPGPAATPTPVPLMRPPDSQMPIAGICSVVFIDFDFVTITRQPDTPSPRCLTVTANQRLSYVNQTADQIRVILGRFDLLIPQGETGLLDAPVGTYLLPGVHIVSVSDADGREIGGGEVWLIEEAPQ